jgi:hypothetical protein
LLHFLSISGRDGRAFIGEPKTMEKVNVDHPEQRPYSASIQLRLNLHTFLRSLCRVINKLLFGSKRRRICLHEFITFLV